MHNPPASLKHLQKWFGAVLRTPLEKNDTLSPIHKDSASLFIMPSNLLPHERIEIYNQQYWWRLYGAMQNTFPSLTRLFGTYDFNQKIAIPYLLAHNSMTWSLYNVALHLTSWIQEYYQEEDSSIVCDMAKLDYLFYTSFLSAVYDDVRSDLINETTLLILQPHVHLFNEIYDFLEFRYDLLEQEPDYWQEHDFPILKKEKTIACIYRKFNTPLICWEPLTPFQFELLSLFKTPTSLEEALDKVTIEDATALQNAFELFFRLRLIYPCNT